MQKSNYRGGRGDCHSYSSMLGIIHSLVIVVSFESIDVGPTQSRYGAEGEGPSIYVTDPEGNVVELKRPPSY